MSDPKPEKKRGRGRPRLPDDERRDVRGVRLTASESKAADDLATSRDLSFSVLMRNLLEAELKRERRRKR